MNEYNFNELCVPVYAELVAFAQKRTGDKQKAQDLVQDAYARAMSAWDRWVPQGEPVIWARSWMYRIVTNVFNNEYARSRKLASLQVDDGESIQATRIAEELHQELESVHPYHRMDSVGDEVREALDRVNPLYGEVLRLIYLEGMMEHEAAAALNIPYGTARSRHARGRQALARLLAPLARRRFGYALKRGRQANHAPAEPLGGSEEAADTLKPSKVVKPDANGVDAVVRQNHTRPLHI